MKKESGAHHNQHSLTHPPTYFPQDIEDLTVASRRKQLDVAQAAYTKAEADFDAFLKAI